MRRLTELFMCWFEGHSWSDWSHDNAYIKNYDAQFRTCRRCHNIETKHPPAAMSMFKKG